MATFWRKGTGARSGSRFPHAGSSALPACNVQLRMRPKSKSYLIGGGIGSLAAAAFMIRDGGVPGENISILEAAPVMGGSLDATGDSAAGYIMRGGRMLTTDNYECTWDLYKSIPSLNHEGQTVFDETVEFNSRHPSHAMARLVDCRRSKVPVTSMGFSMEDRMELLKLSQTSEDTLAGSSITDWFSPGFFETEFWYMWATTFAFQPWHSAVEFRRYLHRFLLEFSRIETLAGVKRTIYNQYDSLVLPLQTWLAAHGVHLVADCKVTDFDHKTENGKFTVTGIHCLRQDKSEVIAVNDGDFVFFQNGSMTDASSLGSMTSAPEKLTKADSGGWTLWEKLAEGRPEFGNPAAFNSCIAQSCWESFTVTLKNPAFFDQMIQFSGNRAGHWRAGHVQRLELADVDCAGPSTSLREPARRRAGILGIRAVSGPGRQFRSEADGRVERRRDSAGTLRSPAIRSGDCSIGQLHSLQNALHHQHVHAAHTQRSAAAGASWIEEPRVHQPVRRDSRTMSSLQWSIRCGRPRWPSTSCLVSIARSRP